MDLVFLHLHCSVEGCSNVFVKCEKSDAEKLLENLEILNQFVEICILNGGRSRIFNERGENLNL